MKKLFGTDGIRGPANRHPMTPEIALAMGQAISFYFSKKKGGGRIVIGKDTRRSSYMFEYALCAGISSMGSLAILTGPLPTPGIAFLTRAMRADAGVVISASHNNFQDNGIKFFDSEGFKLPDAIETQMEEFIFTSHHDELRPTGGAIGRAIRIDDAVGRYTEFLKSTFPKNLTLSGIKIVLDCANGAAYSVAPQVLTEMGADVEVLNAKPDGTNINANCGALHPEQMCERVRQTGAHLGIALDGDADRLILCDENGNVIDGDRVLAMSAIDLQERGKLAQNTVVGTVMSNMGLEVFLRDRGIRLQRTSVGDRFIVELMRQEGYILGGEPSGHLVFMEHSTTGDGLLAALVILALSIRRGQSLSELASVMPLYPQKIVNIPVKQRKKLEGLTNIQAELIRVEKQMKQRGRVVLRYSGTEPLLRLMVEGEDINLIDQSIASLQSVIQQDLT